MTQDIGPSMGDLMSSNAKARLDLGPIATFTAFHKETGAALEVDPRTFDPSFMTKDKAEADAIVQAREAAIAAEKARLEAEEKAKFDAAVEAEVQRRLKGGKGSRQD